MAFYGIKKNIATKLVDIFSQWIGFHLLLYVVPTIVIKVVDDADVKASVSLVRACALMWKWEITETEVEPDQVTMYASGKITYSYATMRSHIDIKVFTISQHYLAHVAHIIR